MHSTPLTRRSFVGQSAALASGAVLASQFPAVLRGATEDKKLKIALVGCGGGGSGAANQALRRTRMFLSGGGRCGGGTGRRGVNNLRASNAEKIAPDVQKFLDWMRSIRCSQRMWMWCC